MPVQNRIIGDGAFSPCSNGRNFLQNGRLYEIGFRVMIR